MADTEARRTRLAIEAIDPNEPDQKKLVYISFERMQTVGKRSMGHAKECGHIVPMVLQHPTAVFQGLRQDEDDDPQGVGWQCFCMAPPYSYREDGTQAGPRRGFVYLVFVNDEGVAYNWRWERADPEDPTLPQNHLERFKSRIL